jgi:tetratricopeptide (TPR) repeat protein
VRRRQGRLADAHALLACLPESAPAALLAGSLALGEGDAAAAEAEFDRACRLDPSSWPATANRALARLSLGRGSEDVRSAGAWAPAEESGWWTTLAAAWEGAPLPEGIADADVSRAAGVLVGLGRPVEALAALRRLAEVRPGSEVVRRAVADAVLLVALEHLNAGDWLGAERELAALARTDPSPTTLNLWGCAAALGQDFAGAAKTFQAALRAGEDARMWHNLALAREWAGENAAALAAWRRLLDALQADRADSRRQFAVAGRAAGFAERARQDGVAIEFWERAVRLRPDEIGLVERLFVLYHRSGRTTEAKAALRRLRNLRPKEGRWLVYEAELLPLERAGDLDEVFPVLERLREALAGDRKLADAVVGRLLPGFEALADRVKTRFKRLRSDADDDPEEMDLRALRQLRKDAQRLRQAVERCLRFTLRPALQTRLDELDDELDRRVAACLRWEEGS